MTVCPHCGGSPCTPVLIMAVTVDGECFCLFRKDRGPDPQWVITDSVGDLYAYLDEKAAIADFSAMFARPARRAA